VNQSTQRVIGEKPGLFNLTEELGNVTLDADPLVGSLFGLKIICINRSNRKAMWTLYIPHGKLPFFSL